MSGSISKTNLDKFNKNFNSNPINKLSRNALTRSNLLDVAMDWDSFRKIDHNYSDIIPNEMKKVTNQKSSGRCWGFAGLNLMRIEVAKKYNLKNFEFSQNYFMFCDKIEKANYFLENIISTLDEPFDSRLMMWLVSEPVQDGGQWDMFVNLMEKYGAMPQSVMAESYQSSQSHLMNRFITRKLRENASTLRNMHKSGIKISALRKEKESMLSTIYNMLCICLGTPPKTFDWQFRDENKKFNRITDLTPLDFYNKHVNIKLTDTTNYGHFGRENLPWEKIDLTNKLGEL